MLALSAVILGSCTEPGVSGTLALEALDDGAALTVTFVPTGAGSLEDVYLEFQAVATKLVLQGSSAVRTGCLQLPASGTLVVLTDEDRMPPGASVRVAAWHYQGGAAADPEATPVRARCTGTMITDAYYATPLPPDAGRPADAGAGPDAALADAMLPDVSVDGGARADGGDASVTDDGAVIPPEDAAVADTGTSSTAGDASAGGHDASLGDVGTSSTTTVAAGDAGVLDGA